MIKLKRDDVVLSIATLVKRSMEGYDCESEIERIWNCSLCPLSYMRESGLRKHMLAAHQVRFHRAGLPTPIPMSEAKDRLEAMRNRQANSHQRRKVRALRAAEAVGSPPDLETAGHGTTVDVDPIMMDIGWPDLAADLNLLPSILVVRETDTQTDDVVFTDVAVGEASVTQEDKETNTEAGPTVGVQVAQRGVPGLPPALSIDDVMRYIRDHPEKSADQSARALFPGDCGTLMSERWEFQQLVAVLMFAQRQAVRDLRSRVALISRARPEDRPAMLCGRNSTTDELADRCI